MKYFTNREVWIWVLAALLVINLATTGTILWRQYRMSAPPEHIPFPHNRPDDRPPRGAGMRHEHMDFTPEQDEKLKVERDRFFNKSRVIIQRLRENQDSIFAEMNHEIVDTLLLFRLADETGLLQAQLRKEAIIHILETKELTSPEQFEKLSEMMKRWMQPGPSGGPDRLRNHRRGGPDMKDTVEFRRGPRGGRS